MAPKKIDSLNINLLSQDAAFGFLNEVDRQIHEVFATPPSYYTRFDTALATFESALRGEANMIASSALAEADRIADNAWYSLKACLKVMVTCPDDAVREAAEKVNAVFNRYANPTDMKYETEYGILKRLLSDLNELSSEVISKSGTALWIKSLYKSYAAFTDLYSQYMQSKSQKILGEAKTARQEAYSAYRELVKIINVMLLVEPSEELNAFASVLNQIIAKHQTSLKTQKTLKNNKAATTSAQKTDAPSES